MFKKMKRGFTLIELLIVITIIGVLSALIVVGYNSAKVSSRDAKRIADINSLDSAARLLYEDTKQVFMNACDNHTSTVCDASMPNAYVSDYINQIPHDPSYSTCQSNNSVEYTMYTFAGTTAAGPTCRNGDYCGAAQTCPDACFQSSPANYVLSARLENTNNRYINTANACNDTVAFGSNALCYAVQHCFWGGGVNHYDSAYYTNRYFVAGP